MPRFTPAQVRQRRMTVAIAAGLAVLLVLGLITVAIFGVPGLKGRVQGFGRSGEVTEVHEADDSALQVLATPADAPARQNMVADLELEADEVLGIDVSAHQGEIDWDRVAGDGYSFAVIKATEGSGYVDPAYERNWAGAQEAGLTVGAYHYFTLCSPGAEQAADFLEAVPVDDAALPPALDLEFDGACDARPEAEKAQAEIDAFVDRVEEAWGRRVIIYSSAEWRAHYGLPVAEGRPEWLHNDLGRPEADDWSIWQMRFDGTVSGIRGGVDVDALRVEVLRDHAAISDAERRSMQDALDERLREKAAAPRALRRA